jgi:hypothetical protein
MKALALTAASAALLIITGCAEAVPIGNPTADPPPPGQASGAAVQAITIPLGKHSGVEARLPISGYSGLPGSEITYDASGSGGVVVKYEWDLDGNGTYDRTTTDPVLKHTYPSEFEGLMILRVTGIAGGTDTVETPVRISTRPLHQRLAAPSNVRIEVLSTVGRISEVKVSWESADPAVYRWGVTLDGFPAGVVERSVRSVTVTEVHHEKDVLIEVLGLTSEGALGDRRGTVLSAAE